MSTFRARQRSSSPLAVVVFVIAVIAGLALLGFGIYRVVDSIESDPSPATAAFVTTTTAASSSSLATATTTTTVASTVTTTDFALLTDESGRLSVEFPSDWTDVGGGGWSVENATVGVSISAAIDRDAWYSGWGTPGAFLGISEVTLDEFTPDLVDFSASCVLADTGGREYPGYTTVVQEWVECGTDGSQFTTALIWPSTFEWSGLVQIVTLDGTATALLDHVMATLSYEQ